VTWGKLTNAVAYYIGSVEENDMQPQGAKGYLSSKISWKKPYPTSRRWGRRSGDTWGGRKIGMYRGRWSYFSNKT